jgi:hypothetical protein
MPTPLEQESPQAAKEPFPSGLESPVNPPARSLPMTSLL